MGALRLFFLFALLSTAAVADGLIVQRGESGLQFLTAMSPTVNGKDRAQNMGDKPEPSGPINKLASVKLAGTLILDLNSGVVAGYTRGARAQYLYPNGLSKKVPSPPAEAWKESTISFKKSQQEKTAVDLPASQFVAFLAGGVPELAELCMDTAALVLIAGPKGAFAAQLELTAAAVAAFGSQPAMASIERDVADFLRARLVDFSNGVESAKSLEQGLRFAELSAKAYPTLPAHQGYRKQLAESKTWLDRRVAILKALAAGSEWDAFLLSYVDFEKHQASFPTLMEIQRRALKESMDEHWKSGKARVSRGEFRRAYGELRLASARQPSNVTLKKDVAIAWVEHSRQVAVDRRAKPGAKQLSPGEREAVTQALHFAERYRQQKKLDDALKHVLDAERGDPQSLEVLLAKAAILGARGEIGKALGTLDRFDQHAVDEERTPGNKLRNDLMFQLNDSLNDHHRKLGEAWAAGRYHQTLRLARQGLLVDENDPATLYYAGVSSLVTRDRKGGTALLSKYLAVSNTLDADLPRRVAVSRLLMGAEEDKNTEAGDPAWFSGRKTPAGTFYCPLSLTFIPKVDRIAASNKLSIRYTWEGERLRTIVPSFEKPVPGAPEKSFAFAYNEGVPQVMGVDVDAPRKPPSDPDELIRGSNVLLPNNPLVDTAMLERLTGNPVNVVAAGNRFFHPFIWERPYFFSVRYDERGRAKTARQIPDVTGQPGTVVEFEWSDLRLVSVKAHQGGALIYERTQQYLQDKLMGEEIRAGGKTSKIKYVWNGGQLVSADCDKDESLDGRSRDVFFVSAAGKPRGR